jgi:nucleotide-binding universal stress UspA family protein
MDHWLEHDLAAAPPGVTVELGCAHGIPSVEICRFAENRRADLLILGRKHRTAAVRLLVGDTADAVARRSQVASLYVPPRTAPLQRILVALDGTERGFVVFRAAAALASAIGAGIQPVTVEPAQNGDAAHIPSSRTLALINQLDRLATPANRKALAQAAGEGRSMKDMLMIRYGEPVAQLLEAAEAASADVVAIGNRRGGPPGPVEGGSIARRFAHVAPQALLAVPL